jgi:PKD repeat protein
MKLVAYAWDFGDGSSDTTAVARHAYADDGAFVVTLVVTDQSGLSDIAKTTATIGNVAPQLGPVGPPSEDTQAPKCVEPAPPHSFHKGGTFTDPGIADTWTVVVDWGDGTTPEDVGSRAVPGSDPGVREFRLAYCYLPGTYTVTITVSDDDGGRDELSFGIQVDETGVSPDNTPTGDDVTVQPEDPGTGTSPVTLSFTNIEASGETTLSMTSVGPPPPQGFRVGNPPLYYDVQTNAQHSGPIVVCINYREDRFQNENLLRLMHDDGHGWRDVTLDGYPDTVLNRICGEVASLSPFAVMETNTAPEVVAIALPLDPQPVAVLVPIVANFKDADPSDIHEATIDWGDGTSTIATVVEAGGAGTVEGAHSYAGAGVYTVGVRVTDGDLQGSRTSASDVPAYVVVYDPSAGFVTGGGWIDSPEGAYTPRPTLSGKATFGFVAKYLPGARTPSGNTEFHFKAASFEFRSASYEWLVVAGARGQFKGTGTINGAGNYGFLLTAIDGQVNGGGGADRFRIKITDPATGAVVYDNQMGQGDDSPSATALGGGSIQIKGQ